MNVPFVDLQAQYRSIKEEIGHKPEDFPEATKASKEILSLPMYPELEEAQIMYIAEKMKAFFQ